MKKRETNMKHIKRINELNEESKTLSPERKKELKDFQKNTEEKLVV